MTGSKNIGKTLKSIANQTYPNIETMVIDNFSKDTTSKTCENYNIKFFSLKCGRSGARNYGIEHMKGKYALFVDSDHILSPTLVADCVVQSIRQGANCIKVPVYFVSTETSRINCSKMRNLEFESGLGIQTLLLFFSRELSQRIRFPESVDLGEDFIFSSKALELNPVISTVESRIFHVEEGTAKALILRSWNYGRKFNSTKKEIGSANSARLLVSLSAFNLAKLKRIISNTSRSPNVVFSFSLYILLKHFTFLVSWFFSSLSAKSQYYFNLGSQASAKNGRLQEHPSKYSQQSDGLSRFPQ
jgi:glycosyltransferase involved in cell wall biosynthesis